MVVAENTAKFLRKDKKQADDVGKDVVNAGTKMVE